jgi:hypothetical protein
MQGIGLGIGESRIAALIPPFGCLWYSVLKSLANSERTPRGPKITLGSIQTSRAPYSCRIERAASLSRKRTNEPVAPFSPSDAENLVPAAPVGELRRQPSPPPFASPVDFLRPRPPSSPTFPSPWLPLPAPNPNPSGTAAGFGRPATGGG